MDWLEFLPQGAAVVGVLIAIWMFLKHQYSYVARIEQIGSDCHGLSKQMQVTYQGMHEAMLKQFSETTHLIMESHNQQCSGVAVAMKELSDNNRSVEIALTKLVEKIER